MAKKNKIFSGRKPPKNQPTYEQFWSDYLTKKAANAPQLEEARRKRSARAKIQYATRLANATESVEYKGKYYSPESNRMRYLMEQLSDEDRRRLRKGIYDDSDTQRQIAEQMLMEDDMSDERLKQLKAENEDLWNRRNAKTLNDLGGKLPPPKMPF